MIGPLLGAAILCAVLWVLHRELEHLRYRDIIAELQALPRSRVLLAVLCTVANYWLLTGYDVLATRYVRHPVAYRRVALASFSSYAFSNSVGFSVLGSTAIRYRLYSLWGLSTLEIATVVLFSALTTWLGIMTVGGVALLVRPAALAQALHLPTAMPLLLGALSLGMVAAYALLAGGRRRPVRVRTWELTVPSLALRVSQVFLAALDWAMAGFVLYALLPPGSGLTAPVFYGIYVTAQVAGLVSTVPGGFGVLETILLVLLKPYLAPETVLGSLVAFRGIYYVLPLCAGALALGTHEVVLRKEAGRRIARTMAEWSAPLVPHAFAVVAFFGGAVLLVSAATPSPPERLAWVGRLVPLAVLEASHFLGSLVGVGLLLVARGLQRRIDGAYYAAVALLACGVVLSLTKGGRYEEAIVLLALLGVLLPCRREFYRRASVLSRRFTVGWAAAVIMAVVCTVWLGFFVHRHVEYSSDLWWRFSLEKGAAPRFLRAAVGMAALTLFATLAALLRPRAPGPAVADSDGLRLAKDIVQRSPRSSAWLALLGDKSFLMNEKKTAFVMYGVHGRSWVAAGDPVGPEEEHAGLVWQFRELADVYGGRAVFHDVGADSLPLYVDAGLVLFKVGERAVVPLEDFSLAGNSRKTLRRDRNQTEKAGLAFEVVSPPHPPALMEQFRDVSNAWLAHKRTREKGFSLGFFEEGYLAHFPIAFLRQGRTIVAFANVLIGAGKEEVSVDLMRYVPDAPAGVMAHLFVDLMFWGKEQGYRRFDMGNAPLAGVEGGAAAPLWHRLSTFVFRYGEHFYNFRGLRSYKGKFAPVWEPRYLACAGVLSLPQALVDLTALTSRGVWGALAR
jgi:phosphatidylglycerol lysyltransferase